MWNNTSPYHLFLFEATFSNFPIAFFLVLPYIIQLRYVDSSLFSPDSITFNISCCYKFFRHFCLIMCPRKCIRSFLIVSICSFVVPILLPSCSHFLFVVVSAFGDGNTSLPPQVSSTICEEIFKHPLPYWRWDIKQQLSRAVFDFNETILSLNRLFIF